MKTSFFGRFGKLIGTAAFIVASLVQLVDPFPAQAWWDVYHGGYGHDYGSGVAIDGDGNVIVVGYRSTEVPPTYTNQGVNAYLRKYDNLGNYVCDREVNGAGIASESSDSFSDVAVDSNGNYIVSGTISGYYNSNGYYNAMYLNKFDTSCAPVWANPVIYQYPDDSAWQSTYSVTLDAADNIYPTGTVFGNWGPIQGEWATWKYDTNGVLQNGFPIFYNYSSSYQWTDYSQDVAVDSLGNIVIVGFIGQALGNYNWHVRKYDASRNLLWTDTFVGAANLVDLAYRVAIDSEDNPIVVGYTNKGTASTADNDWLVIKYRAEGDGLVAHRLWTQTYESAVGKDEGCYSVAVDQNDNVIVGGLVRTDSSTFTGVLALLDGTTGTLLDAMDLPGPANILPTRLEFRDGLIAVGGYVFGSTAPNYNDLYVALLDIYPPETQASPAGGFSRTTQKVTLSTNEPATVHYTTNGATPTTASRKYTGPISIASDTTLKFFAVDTAGNMEEEVKTETYVFDTVPPANGTLTITPAAVEQKFDLSWTVFDDGSGSGVKEYWLVVGTSGYLPCTATGAARISTGLLREYTTGTLQLNKIYYFRACASDNVGNVSTGATAAKKVLTDYDPPTGGSVVIHGTAGDAYTKTAAVTLELFASGATQMCVSNGNGNTCSSWVAYATAKAWTLAAGSGIQTVKVWFRDSLGNVSDPASDTIYRDTTPPVNGTLTIEPGTEAGTFDLSWPGFDDGGGSGVKEYWLVVGTSGYLACTVTGPAKIPMGVDTKYTTAPLALGRNYYFRACASDNVGNVSTGATAAKKVLTEYDPPTGTVKIKGKNVYFDGVDKYYTRYAAVTLELTRSDATQICVSNAPTCSSWVTYPATNVKPWTLSAGSGEKTVRVWFRDSLGNVSEPSYDTIYLDTTRPVTGTLTIEPVEGEQKFRLSWSGFSDDLSGLMAFRLVGRAGSPPGCGEEAYTLVQDTLATEFTTGLLDLGTTYYYRVCAMDNVENYENGAAAVKKVLPEYDPPTGGSIVINGKDMYTNGPDRYTKFAPVTLALTATGATQMCVSNGSTCTSWVAYAATKAWTLPAGSGQKTVNVWFRDEYGNATKPYSDTIVLDTTKPVSGTLSIAVGEVDLTFDLSWTEFSDGPSGSGVKMEYWLVFGTSGAPACTVTGPARIYTGTNATYKHEGLTFGRTYSYRVCAQDNVGNVSTGATASRKMQ